MMWTDVDSLPEDRAQSLLEEMTTDEKFAQLTSIFPYEGDTRSVQEVIEQEAPLGIGTVSTLVMRSIKSLDEATEWQRDIQKRVIANSPHGIPAMFHMEGLCGAFIQDSQSFPSGIARGASFDAELEENVASIVAKQELALGITQMFAPVLDVSRDSRMGRRGESYGEDPYLVGMLGSAYVLGAQRERVGGRQTQCVAKHFTSFHNSTGGIHGADSLTPGRLLREIYAKPFGMAIKRANLLGIMPCYDTIDGLPASVSKPLLTDLLRGELGFKGMCVSDYGGISNSHSVQHIGETFEDAGLMALKAGMDMELPSRICFGDALKKKFEAGEADISLVDTAVKRVLTAKFKMGLFESPFAYAGKELHTVFFDVDKTVSLRSAKESLVLLKNDGVLPLSKNTKTIAVIGPHADHAGRMFGGYTHFSMAESLLAVASSIAGAGAGEEGQQGQKDVCFVPGTQVQRDEGKAFRDILKRQKPDCTSLYEELTAVLPDTKVLYAYGYPVAGADESGFEDALSIIKQSDVVILTLGGKHGTSSISTMGEGVDAAETGLPPCQNAFIRRAAKMGKPIVGVHFDGRPISSDAADECLNAILEAFSPAEYGAKAVAGALFGDFSPSGKLPISVERCTGQIPIYYNHPNGSAWHQGQSIGFANYVDCPHTPRYPFGYGLSYSSFEYSDISQDTDMVAPDGSVNVSFNIKNTGTCSACEIAQVYISDEWASMVRPVKELAGFQRVYLNAGGEKRITVKIEAQAAAFLNQDMEYKAEKGKILVQVGSSSEDIRLRSSFEIT